jgi:hypothetical protein
MIVQPPRITEPAANRPAFSPGQVTVGNKSMKSQTLAAIAVTIALGFGSAGAQTNNPATSPDNTAATNSKVAAQTPPANGPAANTAATAQPATPPAANPPATDTSAGAQAAPPSGANATIGTATINPTGIPPSQRNPLLADNGSVRISKLIGTTIYNKDDKKVGSVDDVLASQNGQLQVVVSTGNKKTVVPWNRLVFGDAKLNADNKVLMPDATQDQLDKMQAFNYVNNNSNKK